MAEKKRNISNGRFVVLLHLLPTDYNKFSFHLLLLLLCHFFFPGRRGYRLRTIKFVELTWWLSIDRRTINSNDANNSIKIFHTINHNWNGEINQLTAHVTDRCKKYGNEKSKKNLAFPLVHIVMNKWMMWLWQRDEKLKKRKYSKNTSKRNKVQCEREGKGRIHLNVS